MSERRILAFSLHFGLYEMTALSGGGSSARGPDRDKAFSPLAQMTILRAGKEREREKK